MLRTFIERPVLSTVISVIIVILGILGLIKLPISQYPDIAPPTVQVSAAYDGANADVVMKSVIVPLEEQINGVENMTYMTSTASNDGTAVITVYFTLGTNPDMAAVNVQNRVSKATSLLPAEVTKAGVTTTKRQSSMVQIFSLYSENPSYDQTFLQNYANINLLPEIKRISGVGDASVFGTKDYSMRIWLKPQVMAAYKLIPDDISSALAEQNVEAAPGKFGENSNQSFQYTIKYPGRLTSPQEFGNIVIKADANGQVLRLKDVARIELGSQTYTGNTLTDGKPSIGVAIYQTAGSNAHQLIEQIEKTLQKEAKGFPKGIHYMDLFNANDFLDASIEKVVHTLIEAFILVFIVVFIFLQDFRSTLIPAISVPVAIVGTFFFLNLFGFTINLLTLFALVLAIGIVVDDAIVVVEAVHAKLDQGAESAEEASVQSMSEISGAIISITLVMAAVFIPVSFISGSAGVFYKQFGLTLAIAIVLSAINALTLSPALCALFLKPHGEEHKQGLLQRFYAAFNASFNTMTRKYRSAVHFLQRRTWIAGLGVLAFAGIFWYLMKTTPTGFVPNEDQGVLFANITLPVGSSMERSEEVAVQVDKIIHGLPEVESTLRISGQNFIAGAGGAYAMVVIKLKPWDQRKQKGEDINSITSKLFGMTAGIHSAQVLFFAPPTLQGFGNSDGFEFQLQDKTGGDIKKFNDVSNQFLGALNQRPEIRYAATSFNTGFPQYEADVNVVKCKEANVSVSTVLSTLQGYYGSLYASNFNEFGKLYRVILQSDAVYRANVESLNNIYVRNSNNVMSPITEYVSLKRVYGAEAINRFNMFTSISMQGSPKPGFSSGDAIKAIEDVAAKTLPAGYAYEYSGLTREELASGSQTVFIFMLCLIFVYFLLAAQYESYILPFAVLLSLPVGLAGAFIFAHFFGVEDNIYLQITLIMLIGLLAKNAILIVEFAAARRRSGESIIDAAIDGAVARIRPILMTSFAFILGLLPLMLATGAGAVGNRSIGTGAVGGMLIGTIFGVFVIPVLFIVFQGIQEKIGRKPRVGVSVKHAVGIIGIGAAMLTVSSCKTSKTYKTPNVVSNNLFRDSLEKDSTNMADVPWRSLFADTVLQNLIEEGLKNNLDLKNGLYKMAEAQATLRQAKLAYYPTLSANAQVEPMKLSKAAQNYPSGFSIPLSYTTYQFSLNASWELNVWGQLSSLKRQAVANFLEAEANKRALQTQLIADIANDYYTLLAYDAQLKITQQTVKNRADDVETVTSLKEFAVVTGADVVKSRANRYDAEVSIPDIKQSIRETEDALSILLGRAPGMIKRGVLDEQSPTVELKTGVSTQLLRNRPDVQSAEMAFRSAFENTNVAHSYFYPSLSITAEGGPSSLQLKNFFNNSLFYTVVGGLTQPIFNQGQNKARYRIAQAQQEEALNTYQKTILTAGQEVSKALYSYQNAIEKQDLRQKELAELEKAVSYTKDLLKFSSATNYTDVLTAEQSLLAAQLSSINDRLQQLTAVVNLYSALGGGWK